MQKKLTKLQAFNVMLCYLEKLYEKEKSEYLGDILSNSEFWSDGIPADRGSWSDWHKAINKIALQDKTFRNHNRFTPLQACYAMLNYVQNYVDHYDPKPEYLLKLLIFLQLLKSQKNQSMWHDWLRAVDEIMKKDDPRIYLEFVA